MTGLKSGSGDDLWGDDDEPESRESGDASPERDAADALETTPTDEGRDEATAASDGAESAAGDDTETEPSSGESGAAEPAPSADATDARPYVVRRAIQDKSVQFEREERLTFFVHDDVVEGERELVTEVESSLGRDVPKFDVREAVYRAALRNPDDVLDELLGMGYTMDDE